MATYLALLRGINVSGSNPIRMESLRTSLESAGFGNVMTYIQSGNILFSYADSLETVLEDQIRNLILRDYGFNVPVVVMTSDELEESIHENPFVNEDNHSIDSLHITYLSYWPSPELLNTLLPLRDGVDEAVVIGNRIYLNCPMGYGRTRFTNTFFEKKLKLTATTRNWKTIQKLMSMVLEYYNYESS
jgi:uncharacterized protein (DUF1697 family)